MRRSDHPSRPNARTCCCLVSPKTLLMAASEPAFLAGVNVSAATCGGRFSGVHQWPVFGVHRGMERDGVVRRFVHHQVPPKVEYRLTDWGQALCPALDSLLTWVELRPSTEPVPIRPTHGTPLRTIDRASSAHQTD